MRISYTGHNPHMNPINKVLPFPRVILEGTLEQASERAIKRSSDQTDQTVISA